MRFTLRVTRYIGQEQPNGIEVAVFEGDKAIARCYDCILWQQVIDKIVPVLAIGSGELLGDQAFFNVNVKQYDLVKTWDTHRVKIAIWSVFDELGYSDNLLI